jgi:hypothetical protein
MVVKTEKQVEINSLYIVVYQGTFANDRQTYVPIILLPKYTLCSYIWMPSVNILYILLISKLSGFVYS